MKRDQGNKVDLFETPVSLKVDPFWIIPTQDLPIPKYKTLQKFLTKLLCLTVS